MPKISVVIPVYNVEKYLRECLDSVINQTFRDIEIICVDDGSTDDSLGILEEYADKDNRIKIIKQKNQYAGVARNNGLKIATGEYIIFLDSDDYFDLDMFSKMVKNADENNSDIVICKSVAFYQSTGMFEDIEYSLRRNLIPDSVFNPKDKYKYIFQYAVGWPWDKLYRRDFIQKNNLKFQDLRHSNDTYFVLLSMCLADKISVTDEVLVTHRYHDESIANTKEKNIECFYSALTALKRGLQENNIYKECEQSYINYCLDISLWHIKTLKNKKAKKEARKLFVSILKDINFRQYKKDYFYYIAIYERTKMQLRENSPFSILYKLFSITNADDGIRKVITILGLKLKVKI